MPKPYSSRKSPSPPRNLQQPQTSPSSRQTLLDHRRCRRSRARRRCQRFRPQNTGFEARESVLGHMQRGGSPTTFDRVLALRLGAHAANRLISGFSGEMVGVDGNDLCHNPLSYVLSTERTIDPEKLLLVDMMAN
ncbi:hypothetical protein CCB80_15650 [Armatimonadetes bacterium Uphvl-Ar1]|nr:hypothetical protein CCB80_15650 [Armatimonadetes bacterium Uphvl-Ar1]